MSDQPNILFILTDQQSATMLGCAGNGYVRTPAMDGVSATGVRFERAYCTNPVCTASRFSLMTGRMPSAIGMLSNRVAHIDAIPASMQRAGLGHLMRQAGYEVAYGGKEHLPKMTVADVGFRGLGEDDREPLAETAAAFIRTPRTQPFFLVTSFINPHDICYLAMRDYPANDGERAFFAPGFAQEITALDAALQRPAGVDDASFYAHHCPPLPANFEPQADEPEAIRLMLAQRPFRLKAREQWSTRRWREHRWAYARLTEQVDHQIGRVLAALAERGQAERTVVIFTSDHGDMDAAHRLEHKSTLYDEACRIPLLIQAPGGQRGWVDGRHLVSNGLDLLPTCCDYAGIAPPPGLAGRSLRPLVEGKGAPDWRQVLPVECAIGRAVITARHKYCRYDLGANREHLHDLPTDPGEQRNAVHDADQQEAVAHLRAAFQAEFASTARNEADVMVGLKDA